MTEPDEYANNRAEHGEPSVEGFLCDCCEKDECWHEDSGRATTFDGEVMCEDCAKGIGLSRCEGCGLWHETTYRTEEGRLCHKCAVGAGEAKRACR